MSAPIDGTRAVRPGEELNLELSALPTIGTERWVPWVRQADVLLVDGGDATYLCHWMRESGLADCCPDCATGLGRG